jgi:hypothetical protein
MDENKQPCELYEDRLALMVSGDLPDEELAKTMRHLSECDGCRMYWKSMQDDHVALTTLSRSMQDQVQLLERSVIGSILEEEVPVVPRIPWWRWFMNTRSGRTLAAGTVAAIVFFFFMIVQHTAAPFDAWAEVIDNAKNAISCHYRVRNLDSPRTESARIFSDIGFATDTFEDGELVEKWRIDFVGKTAVHMITPLERAVSMTFGDEMIDSYAHKNPKYMFEALSELEHEDLGKRKIDGKRVVGIRVRGHNLIPELMDEAEFELWADPDTKYPVRLDATGTSADGKMTKRVRFYDFEWNEHTDEQDYQPDIPRGYEVIDDVNINMDEKNTIKGLRIYAEETGRYPSTLAYEQLTREMWKRLGRRVLSAGFLPNVHRLRAACGFYGKLVQDEQNVIYFGDRVAPDDADRILMRWKVDEDRYRVIYGDLETDTISGSDLLELESY